ncbi:reverse transcriptase domain-containing protein [Tanacetum coccineum]
MKEVHYHRWLSNPVMVKKHDDSWRMCVDFKDLNKACPKDGYPLPEIDWKVESLCGYPFKYFLDAYKGYHQIKMAKDDEEKTAFITSQGIFCYSKMPFGLKNARATYQRLVDKAFQNKIDKYEVESEKMCLRNVRRYVPGDVQNLNEKLASLNRFLSKSAEKSLPFFKTLKKCTKKSDFQWTQEAEAAFKQMKKLIAELPMLSAPEEKEELIMYLASAKEAISAFLMIERSGKKMPVYFVSRALQGPKIIYTLMEKLVLALILADFIVERLEDDSSYEPTEEKEELPEPWTLFTDGSPCIDGFGAGLILTSTKGSEFRYAMRFRFEAANNEAEYEALIAGLRIAEQMGVKNLQANVDSRLVANQDKKKARAIRRKAPRYAVINEVLYNKSFLGPWLRCVRPLQANYVLREIHEGSCSMHAGPRSVVAKAIRIGYYWPTMHADARKLIRECNDCQWGIDIAGPFPEAPDKVKFLIVAIDYFTKRIEAKPEKLYQTMGSSLETTPSRTGVKSYASTNASPLSSHSSGNWHANIENRGSRHGAEQRSSGNQLGPLRRENRASSNSGSKKAKPKWKNTTTPRSAARALSWGIWSTAATMQVTQRMEGSSDLSGKDPTRS